VGFFCEINKPVRSIGLKNGDAMEFQTHNENQNIRSGLSGDYCFQGAVDCGYAKIVEVFGPSKDCTGSYQIDASWDIMFDDGVFVEIYNYKSGKNYLKNDGEETENIKHWHIMGTEKRHAERIIEILNPLQKTRSCGVENLQ
jgi:hypothetical protein